MSAYVVEDKTINQVITFIAMDREAGYIRRMIESQLGIDIETEVGMETLGKLMFSLNCDAVNQRYGDDQAKEFRKLNYRFTRTLCLSRIQAYKSLGCWIYQCSEGDIDETQLYKTMSQVKGDLAEMIVNRLDVYERATWA